jgi:hypothetical protein
MLILCYLFSGIYDIHIKWKGRHIPKSPFRVKVSSDLDSSKCYAEGPGLQSGIVEHKWTNFTVFTKGACLIYVSHYVYVSHCVYSSNLNWQGKLLTQAGQRSYLFIWNRVTRHLLHD